jgi:hypothetical protein
MAETLIRLFEDSRQPGDCHGCEASIEWFETLGGRRMPMNTGAVPRKSENDPATRRVVAFYSAEDSHFATCSERAQFSHKGRR